MSAEQKPKWSTAATVMANPTAAREEIHALRAEVERLKSALQSAVDYVVRKESHKGAMDAEQLAAAEKEFRRTLGSVGTGRWAGDTIYFDLHAAQKLIDGK